MKSRQSVSLLLLTFLLLVGACTRQFETDAGIASCHIVFDAGSSRTRLYIYEQTETGWLTHRGPSTDALADPVRATRGKTMSDARVVVDNIVATLESIRRDGPLDGDGELQWRGFDWQTHCNIETAAVYGTAGMRLAEQKDVEASKLLWKMLNDRLSEFLSMSVSTRTLTGFEEGLFAWLAVREGTVDENFGLAEMGGASVQLTFPCRDCDSSRQIRVKGQLIPVFSDSLLGLGQDEAWKKFGPLTSCERGVGLEDPNWTINECAMQMPLISDELTGTSDQVLKNQGLDWYLTGAFRYMRDTDIDQYCRKGMDSGYQQETSCFRAVYLKKILDTLGVPGSALMNNQDWTMGALICADTRCMD